MQVRDMVEKVLKEIPSTRNSDTYLYFELVNFFLNCWITRAQIETMRQIPFETVTRIRRELSHDKEYEASIEVQKEREAKREEMIAKYGPDGRKHLLEVMERNKQRQEEASRLF